MSSPGIFALLEAYNQGWQMNTNGRMNSSIYITHDITTHELTMERI